MYPNLVSLNCLGLEGDVASACPRLQHLACSFEVPVMTLPDSMRSLDIGVNVENDDEVTAVLDGFARLKHLTSLKLDWESCFRSGMSNPSRILRLFSMFGSLTKLQFKCDEEIVFKRHEVEAAVQALVHSNPLLQTVKLQSGEMSDKCLQSFAKLPNLRSLKLMSEGSTEFTKSGIRALLKKHNFESLRKVTLCPVRGMSASVLREIKELPFKEARSISFQSGFFYLRTEAK